MRGQNQSEWEEWETLFEGIEETRSQSQMEAGLLWGGYLLDVSFKRQRTYYGEYDGRGSEVGFYLQPKLVGQVEMRFSFLFSQYRFEAQDSLLDLNVNMGLIRVPLSLIYTFPLRWVQPQLCMGFNLGHLVRRGGYIRYQSEDLFPDYWSSTITSGLHGGLSLQKQLGPHLLIRTGFMMSLDVINPFDKFLGREGHLMVGYRW